MGAVLAGRGYTYRTWIPSETNLVFPDVSEDAMYDLFEAVADYFGLESVTDFITTQHQEQGAIFHRARTLRLAAQREHDAV